LLNPNCRVNTCVTHIMGYNRERRIKKSRAARVDHSVRI